jgi:hypothetical protein
MGIVSIRGVLAEEEVGLSQPERERGKTAESRMKTKAENTAKVFFILNASLLF